MLFCYIIPEAIIVRMRVHWLIIEIYFSVSTMVTVKIEFFTVYNTIPALMLIGSRNMKLYIVFCTLPTCKGPVQVDFLWRNSESCETLENFLTTAALNRIKATET